MASKDEDDEKEKKEMETKQTNKHTLSHRYTGVNEIENAEFKWNISDEMLITLPLDHTHTRACALFCPLPFFLSPSIFSVCASVLFNETIRSEFHSNRVVHSDDNFLRLNCFIHILVHSLSPSLNHETLFDFDIIGFIRNLSCLTYQST